MTASIASLYDAHLRIQKTRTDAALAACGFDSLAIYAGRAPMKFLDDQPYPFVVNPHFKAWTPQPDAQECWIVYRPGSPLQLIFLQPVDYWHKPPELPSAYWTQHFTITVIRSAEEARSHVGTPLGSKGRCAFIGDWQEEFSQWGFAASNPQQLLDRLHYSRAIKTAYEIECMRQASILAARGHLAAEAAFRAGASEYQIHLDFVRATQHTETELPYSSIVALNRNAAVLHYQHLERRAPAALHSFLLDAGAPFAGYAADVTRTYASNPDDFAKLVV